MSLSVAIRQTFAAHGAQPFAVEAEFDIASGQTLALLGPSGSGKTLLLEAIAGLHPHQGFVSMDGQDLTHQRPEQRGFGFVFQDYALFPHLRVRDNVAFGIRYHDAHANPDTLLQRFGTSHLADRYPPSLSGGEQQRVALARALAVKPRVLLLDEPLSSLDLPAREALRTDLADVLEDMTAIYVTHDREEAHMLADRVAVIHNGHIAQIGTPDAVFSQPTNAFVARFTGSNCVPAGNLPTGFNGFQGSADGLFFVIRPEHVGLQRTGDAAVTGQVQRVVSEGAGYRVSLRVGEARLDALTSHPPPADTHVGLSWASNQAWFLPDGTLPRS